VWVNKTNTQDLEPKPLLIPKEDYNARVTLDAEQFDVEYSQFLEVDVADREFSTITLGPGVAIEYAYKPIEIIYSETATGTSVETCRVSAAEKLQDY
jgi:hypothetical protein